MKEQVSILRPHRSSYIGLTDTCMHSVYLHHIKGVKSMPNEAMERGIEKHLLFEQLARADEGVAVSEADAEAWARVKHLAAYREVETKLGVDINGFPVAYDDPKVFLRGTIDVIDSIENRIIDWKMGQGLQYTQAQADIYAILYAAHYSPAERFEFKFIYPFVIKDNKPVETGFLYQPEDIPGLFDNIKYRLIENEYLVSLKNSDKPLDWEPNLSNCDRCLYAHGCGYYNKPVQVAGELVELPNLELNNVTAAKCVLVLEQMEKLKKLGTAALKAYTKEYGPVPLPDGKFWGHHNKTRLKVANVQQLAEELAKSGFDMEHILEVISFPPVAAKKLCLTYGIDPDKFIFETQTNSHGVYNGGK